MAARIVIELSDRECELLDRVATEGGFDNREAALHATLDRALASARDEEIAEAYRRAYGSTPEDEGWGAAGLRLAAQRLRDGG